MKDKIWTKEQLLQEVSFLRARVDELENIKTELKQNQHAFEEFIKTQKKLQQLYESVSQYR